MDTSPIKDGYFWYGKSNYLGLFLLGYLHHSSPQKVPLPPFRGGALYRLARFMRLTLLWSF